MRSLNATTRSNACSPWLEWSPHINGDPAQPHKQISDILKRYILITQVSSPTPKYVSWRDEKMITHWGNQNWKRHVYPNVHRSTVYIARTWKQPRCPSADEWIRKLWYIYTMEYYSAIKKNTFESVLMRRMKLEPIIQSEVSQKEKHQYSILMHIYGI